MLPLPNMVNVLRSPRSLPYTECDAFYFYGPILDVSVAGVVFVIGTLPGLIRGPMCYSIDQHSLEHMLLNKTSTSSNT